MRGEPAAQSSRLLFYRPVQRDIVNVDETTRAYIAGFLDGDGNITFQLVRRQDYIHGFQIRASVCFYQRTSSRMILEWLKIRFGLGYIRNRAGFVSDYSLVG